MSPTLTESGYVPPPCRQRRKGRRLLSACVVAALISVIPPAAALADPTGLIVNATTTQKWTEGSVDNLIVSFDLCDEYEEELNSGYDGYGPCTWEVAAATAPVDQPCPTGHLGYLSLDNDSFLWSTGTPSNQVGTGNGTIESGRATFSLRSNPSERPRSIVCLYALFTHVPVFWNPEPEHKCGDPETVARCTVLYGAELVASAPLTVIRTPAAAPDKCAKKRRYLRKLRRKLRRSIARLHRSRSKVKLRRQAKRLRRRVVLQRRATRRCVNRQDANASAMDRGAEVTIHSAR